MEGRLCGQIVKAEDKRLVGCLVTAVYRLRFDHSVEFQDTEVQGTLEGAVVCPCEGKGKCIDFTSFDESKNPNPWMLDGCEFFVADASGAPAGNAEITSIGGTVNGLNAGHELRILCRGLIVETDRTASGPVRKADRGLLALVSVDQCQLHGPVGPVVDTAPLRCAPRVLRPSARQS